MPNRPAKTGNSRVAFVPGGVGPGHAPVYMELARAGALSWPRGSATPVEIPDPDRRGEYIIVDSIPPARQLPTLPIVARYTNELSLFLKQTRTNCENDVLVSLGTCEDPRNFNSVPATGKIVVLSGARISQYQTGDLGSLESGQNALIDETINLEGQDVAEAGPMNYGRLADATVARQIVSIAICDRLQCAGVCGPGSDGCQVIFAVEIAAGGAKPLLFFSQDGGATWGTTLVDTLDADDVPTHVFCSGDYVVVVAEADESLHYANIADTLAATETWTEVVTGITATKGPTRGFSLSAGLNWIVAEDGYIYSSDDITSGVEAQTAGTLTTEDLMAIHGFDANNLVAVGDNNALLYTTNGGTTWLARTGPSVGDNLTAVWMHSKYVWFVGNDDGELWYTEDAGVTWTQKGFNGSGAGAVKDIRFSNSAVGYLAHSTAAPAGRILRTVNGGYSWQVDVSSSVSPAIDHINELAVCADTNQVFGAGLDGAGTDGVILKGVGGA